jgi:phosphoribosyl 1,2-cyclic phosphodiesterase
MKIYSLSSGSKGNATLIECDNFNILIDVGTSKKYLLNSLHKIGKSLEEIDMLLITHFHVDHAKNINSFSQEIIYSSKDEHKSLQENIDNDFYGISIKPFCLSHDKDCLGYQIKQNGTTYTHISDTGYLKNEYLDLIRESDYLYLEFNHDIEMLAKTARPYQIKQRILSDVGHLNNQDAALALVKSSDKLKELFVAHISDEANDISLIQKEIDMMFAEFEQEINFEIKYTGFEKIVIGGLDET